jgi:hypothetical protein
MNIQAILAAIAALLAYVAAIFPQLQTLIVNLINAFK